LKKLTCFSSVVIVLRFVYVLLNYLLMLFPYRHTALAAAFDKYRILNSMGTCNFLHFLTQLFGSNTAKLAQQLSRIFERQGQISVHHVLPNTWWAITACH